MATEIDASTNFPLVIEALKDLIASEGNVGAENGL